MADGPARRLPQAAYSGDAQVFSDYLAETRQPFLLLNEVGGQQVHVRFTGRFGGEAVVWDCRFLALNADTGELKSADTDQPGSMSRCFIEIGQPGSYGIPLRVGLNLPLIDIPSIHKMIIMIRNYKRLRQGRHEFGVSPGR